jgi:hypothetical protein
MAGQVSSTLSGFLIFMSQSGVFSGRRARLDAPWFILNPFLIYLIQDHLWTYSC